MDIVVGKAFLRIGSWWGKSSPSLRSLAVLRGWSATLGLRHGPDSLGRQQWGILDNGRKPDPAISREWRRLFGRKALSSRRKKTVLEKEVPANSVPAAAVIRGGRVLFGMTGRKGSVGGSLSERQKARAQPWKDLLNWGTGVRKGIVECLGEG